MLRRPTTLVNVDSDYHRTGADLGLDIYDDSGICILFAPYVRFLLYILIGNGSELCSYTGVQPPEPHNPSIGGDGSICLSLSLSFSLSLALHLSLSPQMRAIADPNHANHL